MFENSSQFIIVLLVSLLGEFSQMSDSKLGKAVFIAAAVILAEPSLAQSPATNQAAMTFAVQRKAVRLSAMAKGIPVRFLVDTGATMVAFPRTAASRRSCATGCCAWL